jgi:cation:H+ antiporter
MIRSNPMDGVVLLCAWGSTRKREIFLEKAQRVELVTLLVATLYAFTIPLRRSLSLIDTVFLIGLFVVYLVQSSKAEHVTPELSGPPVHLAVCPRGLRRLITVLLFVIPGFTIFIAAEPFANGLLHSARQWGIEEFVLIQWLAPLASESPEFIVAVLFALRARAGEGLGVLISSKVNQWTLLIGMLPLVYSISGGHLVPMRLDARQNEEILLTVAQSLLAVIVLANGRFGLGEGLMLAGLFVTQLLVPSPSIRLLCTGVYFLISVGYLMNRSFRRSLLELLVNGFRTPH